MLVKFAASTCKNGEIRALVRADDARREAAVLDQRHRDLVGVRDDVVVREDIAVGGIDDDAGARAFDLAFAASGWPFEVEESPQQLVLRICGPPATLLVTAMLTTAGEIASSIGANVGSSRARRRLRDRGAGDAAR